MDTGPFLNCTMRYPLGKGNEMVYKATVVKLGDKGERVCLRSLDHAPRGGLDRRLAHPQRPPLRAHEHADAEGGDGVRGHRPGRGGRDPDGKSAIGRDRSQPRCRRNG